MCSLHSAPYAETPEKIKDISFQPKNQNTTKIL